MDENALLSQFEEVARSLSIDIRYEIIKKDGAFYPGGLCRVKGKYVLIVHSKASTKDRIETLARALNRFDLSQVYVRPGLREYLDKFPKDEQPLEEE